MPYPTRPEDSMRTGLPRCLRLPVPLLCCLLLTASFAPALVAQEVADPDVSMRELIEADKESEELLQEVAKSEDRGVPAQSTPLKAMARLSQAVKNRDYEKAAEALDLRYLPDDVEVYSGEDLLQAFRVIFLQQNVVGLGELSDQPEGDLQDGLPSYRDKLGEVKLVDEVIPVYLQRVPDGKGGKVWKISNATVARIPDMWEELGPSPLALKLAGILPQFTFMGMDNWQVVLAAAFLVIAWPLTGLIVNLALRLFLMVWGNFPIATTNFFRGPLRLFLFLQFSRLFIDQLKLSMAARIIMKSSGMSYIAYTILLLGLLSFLRDYQTRKLQRAGNIHYVALLKPFTTILKIVLVTIIALFWAESAGYNMSTVLAGLGVGSLAIALAAQKTMENVIGAVTLYTARPVKAGDFCRFGNVTGTVEEIGLRSTTIRTLDRTLVVIPNAVFSSTEIENYSARDRIRYFRRYRLRLPGAERMQRILDGVRSGFTAQPKVIADTVSVRFEDIDDGTAILRLDAGVATTDYQEFLAVAEALNMLVVQCAGAEGAVFSGPGTLLTTADNDSREESNPDRWPPVGTGNA